MKTNTYTFFDGDHYTCGTMTHDEARDYASSHGCRCWTDRWDKVNQRAVAVVEFDYLVSYADAMRATYEPY